MTKRECKYHFSLSNPVYYRRWFRRLVSAERVIVKPKYFYWSELDGIKEGVCGDPVTITIAPENYFK